MKHRNTVRQATLRSTFFLAGVVLSACGRVPHAPASTGGTKSVERTSLCAPRGLDVVEESSRNVPEWDSKLVFCAYGPEESDAISVDVYLVKAGAAPAKIAQGLVGDFIPLPKARVLFACEYNAVTEATGPLLLDLQGKRTLLPEHAGFLRTCESVGSGEQVLLQYDQLGESEQVFSTIRIFGSAGQLLVEKKIAEEGVVEFSDAGKAYSVRVSDPEVPG